MTQRADRDSPYVGRNNTSGRRRTVGVAARSMSSLQGRPIRADPVVDEPDDNSLMAVIEWMQRHVDRFLATQPGTAEASEALDKWKAAWS